MEKMHYAKEQKELYAPTVRKGPHFVTVPRFQFLEVKGAMEEGETDPSASPAFAEAISILYALSYRIKFISKAQGMDYVVLPLEGLWDIADQWKWTMQIRQPDHVTVAMLDEAMMELRKKKKAFNSECHLYAYEEGFCVQLLHVGPYEKEEPSIRVLQDFAADEGYEFSGPHHEIYINDPARVPAERLKTVIRYPVRKKP